MKLTLSMLICCTALLCSCGGHSIGTPAETYEVTFVLDGGGAGSSRATAVADETALSEMCLYVFDAQGVLVEAVASTSASVVGNYAAGDYNVYALVNCGAGVTDFVTQADIGTAVRSLESQVSDFSMYGSAGFAVPEVPVCTIPAVRMVSKVELRKVTVDFSSRPGLTDSTLTIDAIYVINATGRSVLDEGRDYVPDLWLNQRGYVSGGADGLLYDAVNVSVDDGCVYDTPHYYYCFQNDCVDDTHSPVWSPRHTRLVLDCTLAGRKTYYPIDIISPEGGLLRNRNYRINELVITGFGTDGPDEPIVEVQSYRIAANVTDWEGTYTISEEF